MSKRRRRKKKSYVYGNFVDFVDNKDSIKNNISEFTITEYFRKLAKGLYTVSQQNEHVDNLKEISDYSYIKFVTNREKAIADMMRVFLIQSPSGEEEDMTKYLMSILNTMLVKYKIDEFGNILITKGELEEGESYPCIVAHMDKVHNLYEDYSVHRGNITLKSGDIQEGIWATGYDKLLFKNKDVGGCGDDGAGIFIALQALTYLDKVKVAFFVEEEIGCRGSGAVDMAFFNNCGYILQGDRKGSTDLILDYFGSEVVSTEFLAAITPFAMKYNFSPGDGTITDVMELANRNVGVSVFNFSVGYYNAHTVNEFTLIDELINSTEFALNLMYSLGNKKYAHKYNKLSYKYGGSFKYGSSINHYNYSKHDYAYGYGWEDDYLHGSTYSNDKHNKEKVYESDNCSCSNTHIYLGTLDLDCAECNPFIVESHHFCNCGEQLDERKLSFHCPSCKEIYLKYEKTY